ncbi:MAG: hypothetical protein KF774_02965 [Planctomyces sp.]|nr:hypothetical protein [Planctomyces sp.]
MKTLFSLTLGAALSGVFVGCGDTATDTPSAPVTPPTSASRTEPTGHGPDAAGGAATETEEGTGATTTPEVQEPATEN